MTVIRPNSITGITSITAQANEINVFRHNGVLAGLQLNGVNHHTSAGVSTFHTVNVLGNLDVAGVLTYQDVTNVDSLGIGTFRTGINVSGGQLDVGSNIKLGNAGVITATSFVGSGANLTGLPAGTTINSNTNNYLITGTGTANTLQGEANLTFTGKTLTTKTTSYPETTELTTEFKAGVANGNRYLNRYIKITNTYTGSAHGAIPIVWEANANGSNDKSYGSIGMFSDGAITFYSRAAGSAVNVGSSLGMSERLRIGNDGKLVVYGTSAVNAEFNTSLAAGSYIQFDLSASGATTGYIGAGQQIVTGAAIADFGIRSQSNMVFSTGGSTERLRIKSTGEVHISDRNSSNTGDHFFQAGAFGIRMEDTGGYNRWNIERNYGGFQSTPLVHLSAQGIIGINNPTPEGVALDVTSSRSTAFSATADQRNLAHIIVRNSSDASGRFSSMSFVSGGGTQAEGSINLVQTGNYTGDMTFKMRNGSGSNDWVQAARFLSDGDFDFNKFEPDGTITTTLSSSSSSGNYTTIIPKNTSGIGHLHVYLVSIHWSFNSQGGVPYYCSGAVLWQTPHSNGNGTNHPITMLSSCHVGGNYHLQIRNETGSSSYPGLQAANMNWTAQAGSHYIVKYKRIY